MYVKGNYKLITCVPLIIVTSYLCSNFSSLFGLVHISDTANLASIPVLEDLLRSVPKPPIPHAIQYTFESRLIERRGNDVSLLQ